MSEPETTEAPAEACKPAAHRRVLTGTLFRTPSSPVTFTEEAPPPKPEPVRRPAKVARMLALAYHIQNAIDRGLVADRAEVARRLGLTRARVTQIMDLTLLAPDLQGQLLELESLDGVEPLHERAVRHLFRSPIWAEQREACRWVGPRSFEPTRGGGAHGGSRLPTPRAEHSASGRWIGPDQV